MNSHNVNPYNDERCPSGTRDSESATPLPATNDLESEYLDSLPPAPIDWSLLDNDLVHDDSIVAVIEKVNQNRKGLARIAFWGSVVSFALLISASFLLNSNRLARSDSVYPFPLLLVLFSLAVSTIALCASPGKTRSWMWPILAMVLAVLSLLDFAFFDSLIFPMISR